MKKFSIIIPVYKNEKNIPITIDYIREHLSLFPNYEVEIVMVCDGSPDDSYSVMKEYQKKYPDLIKIACFTRNFGQGAAVHCGLEMATGDVKGVISCDLQDPFELFVDMLEAWEAGYKLVIASREEREDKGIGAVYSKLFHKLVHKFINNKYPAGGFDFYLMDKEVAERFCEVDAANGSVQMLLLWLGFEYKEFKYVRQERKIGKSGWKFGRKIDAVFGLVTTYSPVLLRVFGIIGIILIFFALIAMLGTIIGFVFGIDRYYCLALIIVEFLVMCTGLILFALQMMGEYLWRTFDMTKNRPRYIVADKNE